nr:unnamed protein product [Digitaria exilis]
MSCGTALKFEAGSMPELEHLKLTFCLHKVECLNGASDFGIQHLSTIKVVENTIQREIWKKVTSDVSQAASKLPLGHFPTALLAVSN